MDRPGSKQLRKRNIAEFWVMALARKHTVGQIPIPNRFYARGPCNIKLIKQLSQLLSRRLFEMGKAVKWRKGPIGTLFKYHPSTRDPICLITIDEMADHVIRPPIFAAAA